MVTKEQIIQVLQVVFDPEIQVDVWTLGLIYNLDVKEDTVNIKMTFTSPMCPYGPMLMEDIKSKVMGIEDVKDVNIEITFDPPWKPSDELRATLGI